MAGKHSKAREPFFPFRLRSKKTEKPPLNNKKAAESSGLISSVRRQFHAPAEGQVSSASSVILAESEKAIPGPALFPFMRVVGFILILTAIAFGCIAIYVSLNLRGADNAPKEEALQLPNPMETVTEFMDSVCKEQYFSAYDLLYGYDSLGLENEPQDSYAAIFNRLVRSNISWEPGQCTVESVYATATVFITVPDLSKLMDAANAEINARIEEYIDTQSRIGNDIYNDDGSYTTEFLMHFYDELVDERLESPPFMTVEVPLSLIYSKSGWQIVPNDDLFSALTGGVY